MPLIGAPVYSTSVIEREYRVLLPAVMQIYKAQTHLPARARGLYICIYVCVYCCVVDKEVYVKSRVCLRCHKCDVNNCLNKIDTRCYTVCVCVYNVYNATHSALR